MRAVLAEQGDRSIPTRVGISAPRRSTAATSPVHPHARGDLHPGPDVPAGSVGPSPRAWGSRSEPDSREPNDRSIPTRVGISRGQLTCRCNPSVHPHARGDLGGAHAATSMWDGPSPRAWGSRKLVAGHPVDSRSIPTRVGISKPTSSTTSATAVHPHARGDLSWLPRSGRLPRGPSPRAWGSHSALTRRTATARSIPTRVGISSGHPRSR